jgi:hypothetical protein
VPTAAVGRVLVGAEVVAGSQTATADATEFLTKVLASAPVKVTEIENDARAACAYSARIN